MRKPIIIFSIIIISFVFGACKQHQKLNNLDDIKAYINNEDNGLTKKKTINNLIVSVQYLPHEYLTLKETKEINFSYDSLLKLYKNSYSFLLSIEPKENSDVHSIKAWNEPSVMNFSFPEQITLLIDSNTYDPVLFNAEETYNLREQRVFNLVFAQQDKYDSVFVDSKEFSIKLMDEYFGLGTMYFEFDKKDINEFSSLVIK